MSSLIQSSIIQYLSATMKPGDVVLGVKPSGTPGSLSPSIVRKKDDLAGIEVGFFHLNNPATYLSEFFLKENQLLTKKGRYFIICKPCDAKSVQQIMADQQLDPQRAHLVVYACEGVADMRKIKSAIGLENDFKSVESHEDKLAFTLLSGSMVTLKKNEMLAQKCFNCTANYPVSSPHVFVGDEKKWEKWVASIHNKEPMLQDQIQGSELFAQLKNELKHCIRCNACRNVCHACFCADRCIFDRPKMSVGFLEKEIALEQNLVYHMIRFYHVAPNCTACGECERACPQAIPLSHLYRYFNQKMQDQFGHDPGSSDKIRQVLTNYRFGEDLS